MTTTTATGGTCVQDLACGGRTETRWTRRTEADGITATLLCTVAQGATDRSASATAAATMSALGTLDQLAADHRPGGTPSTRAVSPGCPPARGLRANSLIRTTRLLDLAKDVPSW